MKFLIPSLAFILIHFLTFSQVTSVIEYPISTDDKYFWPLAHSSYGLGSGDKIWVSFDSKYGFWFIEKRNVHFYDLHIGKWKLFDKNNGLFDGSVGVIYHDSKGNTWLGSQRNAAFDGYTTIRLYSGGVSFYNGESLKLFQKDDLDTDSPEIVSISEGREGEILVVTGNPIKPESGMMKSFYPGGLFMFRENQWYNYSTGDTKCPIKYPNGFHVDSSNRLWIKKVRWNSGYQPPKVKLCYFNGEEFIVPNHKAIRGDLFLPAFNSKKTWVASKKGFFQYDHVKNDFEFLGEAEEFPVLDPIVLEDDLVCFFIGSKHLLPNTAFKKKKIL